MKDKIFLAIESSCDETSIAIMAQNGTLLAHKIFSQIDLHQIYGGVVPEISARSHLENIKNLTKFALEEADMTFTNIDAIAVTAGPGLIGGLIIGVNFAATLAEILNIPCYYINHLEGHILSASLTEKIDFPYLLLLASGGHCQIIAVQNVGQYHIYGKTLDDAAGETFDKIANLLNLSYPGGPAIEEAAKSAKQDVSAVFPRPLSGQNNCDFSFSGLKSAFRRKIFDKAELTTDEKANFSAALQKVISDIFIDRLKNALHIFKQNYGAKTISIAFVGGVASNQMIRQSLEGFCHQNAAHLVCPPQEFCTDNAAMIAWVAIQYYNQGYHHGMGEAKACPRWAVNNG